MVLMLDLGNQALQVGVYENRVCILSFRLFSDKLKSEIEYEESLLSYLSYHRMDPKMFSGAILSSVVPSLTPRIQKAASKLVGKPCLLLSNRLKTGLKIRMDNPYEVGSDLLATALGAANDYEEDCLIVDMGPVISFTMVSKDKEFLGGSLFPGLRSSLDQMINSSALLVDTDLSQPKRLLGKTSKESIDSGILYGYESLIRCYSNRMEQEYGKPVRKILTGADASILKDLLKDEFTFNPYLCFDGLYDIYIKNTEKRNEKNEKK